MPKIKLFDPFIDDNEKLAISKVTKSRFWASGSGTGNVAKFEDHFKKYVDSKECVALSSGTASLHLALSMIDIKNKEVILPSMSFISTAHAVVYNGGKPIFADIEPTTLCLSPNSIQNLISSKTRVILPVHFAGMSADLKKIEYICKKNNLILIEDAAHAAGTKYNGRKIGNFGMMTCFSFQMPNGGAITINTKNSKKIKSTLNSKRWCGISNRKGVNYDVSQLGWNYYINEVFEEMSMPYSMIPELSKFCKQQNIIFMSTSFSIKDAEEIEPFVDFHKIASFEINHVRLIEYLIKTQKPLIISTGASGYEEIDFVINLIKKNGGRKIALLQCTSKYPAPSNTLNLSVIPELKKRYNVPVGFSDHSLDPIIAPVLAIGMGATIIEKHFTLDRNLPGPDHASSLNPNELKIMIKGIREAEKMIGSKRKKIIEEEKELRNAGTRAIQAIKNISVGDVLKEGVNFEVLRPGNRLRGTEPRFLESINGKRSLKSIKMGDGILDIE